MRWAWCVLMIALIIEGLRQRLVEGRTMVVDIHSGNGEAKTESQVSCS